MHQNFQHDEFSNDESFDSSLVCSDSMSTISLPSNHSIQLDRSLKTPLAKRTSLDQGNTQKTLSIQKPRGTTMNLDTFDLQQSQFKLAFVVGKNKKNVFIAQSKIKKGANFFHSQLSPPQTKEIFGNHLFSQFLTEPFHFQKQSQPELFVPFFQNLGKNNKKIQLQSCLLERAKEFFSDGIGDSPFTTSDKPQLDKTEIILFKNPTKVKKTNIFLEKQQNLIKTAHFSKKLQRNDLKIHPKKQIFDWNKFELNFQKIHLNPQDIRSDQKIKKKQGIINFQTNQNQVLNYLCFKSLKLADLSVDEFQKPQKIERFCEEKTKLGSLTFEHTKKGCKVLKCLLCNLKMEGESITQRNLYEFFSDKLVLQKLEEKIFSQLFQQVCFKLFKYTTFFPQLTNKQLNPSNVLVQIYSKASKFQAGLVRLGWVDKVIQQNKVFSSFVVEIRQIYFCQKISTYFLLMSDGWSSVWAVVTEKNYLHKFIHKLKICSKVFVGCWKFHPLSNILSFCPGAKLGQKCIQIWYNSTIVLKQTMKLGIGHRLQFYRPLNLCRKQGGILPTVEGLVIRMFSLSSSRQKSYSQRFPESQEFNESYVQILTPESFSILVKFVLPNDQSLAELFRLYFNYQFYFLKISFKERYFLQFTNGISKFYEFQKKHQTQTNTLLTNIIRKRYVNSMTHQQIAFLVIGRFYDIRPKTINSSFQFQRFFIQNDSFTQDTTQLFQQYQLHRVEKVSCNKEKQIMQFHLKKTRFSSSLKSLPSIYEKFDLHRQIQIHVEK